MMTWGDNEQCMLKFNSPKENYKKGPEHTLRKKIDSEVGNTLKKIPFRC